MDGEIDFEADNTYNISSLITVVPDMLGSGYVLNNNTNKEGQTEIKNTTVPPIPQVINAWKLLPLELVELNNRHSREINADRPMVRYTSNPPGALRGLLATKDFKAREVVTEYFRRTNLDRVTVKAPDYDFTFSYADMEPGRDATVIDAWDPITKTIKSMAAYTNDSLGPKKYNARCWRDTKALK